MTQETFLNLSAIDRDKVIKYISIHTVHSYADVKYLADCLVGSRVTGIHPLGFLKLLHLLSFVPDSYNDIINE